MNLLSYLDLIEVMPLELLDRYRINQKLKQNVNQEETLTSIMEASLLRYPS